MSDQASRSDAFYRELSEIPVYLSAQFQGQNILNVTSSTQDHVRKIKRPITNTYFITGDNVSASYGVDTPDVLASVISPSANRLAVLREVSDDGKKRYVEIWIKGKLEASLEVTETHGAFYTDEILSLLSFSPSENALVYTAETKTKDPDDPDAFAKFRFIPPLGEGYPGKKKPGIFLFRWDRSDPLSKPSMSALRFSDVGTNPDLISQAVFASDNRIFAIGYEYTPDHRLLGVKYCPNRLAGVWELNISLPESSEENSEIQCTTTKLTPSHLACRSPRILRDTDGNASLLVWIANPVGGPHASCSTLHALDLRTNEQKLLVDVVWDPKADEFPGLFTTTLPLQPFLQLNMPNGSSSHIVITSNWRSRTVVISISLQDGRVQNLTPDNNDHYSWSVLATDGKDQIVCTRSTPAIPAELVIGNVDPSGGVKWRVVAKPDLSDQLRKELATIETSIVPIPGHHPTETIVLRAKDAVFKQPLPCITAPHGGPHAAATTGFNISHALSVLEGFVVSSPNYTGSVGFGETYIRKLLGQIGTLDVQDCIASIHHLIDLGIAHRGSGRQLLTGGSHGGFLIAHLIGQYPDFFSAAVLRNPVITLGEISTSDIPDWYLEESGLAFEPTTLVTSETYEKLYSMSPISHVDKVRTPVLLLLGEKDARVATSQGKSFFHALKGRGGDVELLCFKDDSHPLESVEAQRVSFEASRKLFAKWRSS